MSGGVRAAVEAVLDGRGADDGEDLELFGALDEGDTGDLASASPLSNLFEAKRGRGGRKPGSKNRRTEEVTRWLLSQGRHPLLVMMEAYGMSPTELAVRIGVLEPTPDQLLDIFKLQVRMAEAVAPYVAQRQPQAVQLDGAGGLSIVFEGVSLPARAGLAGNPGAEGSVLDLLPVGKSDAGSRTAG